MTKNPHAQALGRMGGRAKSADKAKAAQTNGKLGGRPMDKKPSASTLAKRRSRERASRGI